VDDKPRAFPDPQTGMVKKENQQIVPTPKGRIEIDHVEDLTNLWF
jgi:hypothetical protein